MKNSGSIKTLKDFSIWSKFVWAAILVLITLMVSMSLVTSQTYRSSYRSHLSSARSDFENSFSSLSKYEERLVGLISQLQANNEIISLLSVAQDLSATEYKSAEEIILPMLYMLSDEPDNYSCRLYVHSSLDLISNSARILPLDMLEDEEWAQTAMEGWGNWRFLSAGEINGVSPALVAPLRDQQNHWDLVGLLRIDLRQAGLNALLTMPLSQEYTTVYLQTSDGKTIASTASQGEDYLLQGAPVDTLKGFGSEELNTVMVGEDTVFYRSLSHSGWRLVTVVDNQRLHDQLFPQLVVLMLSGCALALVGMCCALPFLLSIVMRIRKFYHYVQGYNKEALRTVPPKYEKLGNDEVGKLIGAYNALLDRIQQLLVHQRQREKKLRELELDVLQAQINPHFLYNTLDAIRWMSKLNKTDEMERTIQNLTRFYRLCLSKGQSVLPVSQELEIIRNYFAIQEARVGKHFQLIIQVPEEILQLHLPKITLQPLVENALLHGILESDSQEGWVSIQGRFKEGVPELCVMDSGAHLSQEVWERALQKPSAQQATSTSNGYGLYNVEHRLCLFFQKDHVMYLDHSDSSRTCIVIPFSTPVEEDLPPESP